MTTTISPIGGNALVRHRASAPTVLPAIGQRGDDAARHLQASRARSSSLGATQRSIQATLARCEQVRASSADLGQRWDSMKQRFSDVLNRCLDDMRPADLADMMAGGRTPQRRPARKVPPLPTWTCAHCGVRGNRSIRGCMACNKPPPPTTVQGAAQPMGDVAGACAALRCVRNQGGGLILLTGAGMSVCSGVPVFRGADGSMSPDFLRFLGAYNAARKRAGLPEADDWFTFSVPQMFMPETAREAWAYWRWRVLRAAVQPASDYGHLARLAAWFGDERVFVQTSNCDGLHTERPGSEQALLEIHGSLSRVQCSGAVRGASASMRPCTEQTWPVDDAFLARLRAEPDWVPMCPACGACCLRPNVMIFGDGTFVSSVLEQQRQRMRAFEDSLTSPEQRNWVVLEVGAGTVVPSIRCAAEELGEQGSGGLIRVNPSRQECEAMQKRTTQVEGKYWPLVARSTEALAAIAKGLCA